MRVISSPEEIQKPATGGGMRTTLQPKESEKPGQASRNMKSVLKSGQALRSENDSSAMALAARPVIHIKNGKLVLNSFNKK